MLMDLVDPLEGGTAYLLYTDEYYRIVGQRLGPEGILATQSGPAGLLSLHECFTTINHTLAGIFSSTVPWHVHVPAFQTLWGFNLASNSPLPTFAEPEELDGRIAARINKPLRFYDSETHRAMFSLPRFVREGIQGETRVNRDGAPVFMV
jgi:spermidine synthase